MSKNTIFNRIKDKEEFSPSPNASGLPGTDNTKFSSNSPSKFPFMWVLVIVFVIMIIISIVIVCLIAKNDRSSSSFGYKFN